VPNIVQEAYACTRDVQVQVGVRTRLKITANVTIQVVNFGTYDLSHARFLASLNSSNRPDVSLALDPTSFGINFRVVKKERNERAVSNVEKQVQIVFYIESFPAN
jgi:hypothetical protein